MKPVFRNTCLALMTALLVDACGGGSGGGNVAEGGIGGTGISNGPITGFGSIFVNGVEYHTESAEVFIEGEHAGTGDAAVRNFLHLGKVVTVESGIPAGGEATATRVSFADNVDGPVEQITILDVNTKELVVLGQTVIIDSNTELANTTWSGIAVNNQLEVSGLVRPDGSIRATFAEKKSEVFVPGGAVEVEGRVTELDSVSRTFNIGSVTVSYSGGTDLTGLDGGLRDGIGVEVKGTFSGGVLQAIRIESEDDLGALPTTAWLEIEGYVSSMLSTTDFVLNGQTARLSPDTRFEQGSASDIAPGVRIEVEGSFEGGTLLATEISFRDDVELQAIVAAVDPDGLVLASLAGVAVFVNAATEIDGAEGLADIPVGDLAKVRGRWDGVNNRLQASRIEVESPSSTVDVKLRGRSSTLDDPFVTILGAVIDTTGLDFRSADGSALSKSEFFNQVRVETPILLRGHQDSSTHELTWTSVRLQDAN